MVILFVILLIIASALLAYTGKMQATTLYVGKKIAHPDLKSMMPTGYQDAITPEIQNKMNDLNIILFICVVISGSIVKWYLGILGLIFEVAIFRAIFAALIVPQKLSFYVNLLVINMANRFADYKKNKDEERAMASKEVGDKLAVYFSIMDKNTKVPSIEEANKAEFGY